MFISLIYECSQFRVKTIKGFSSDRSKVLYTQQQTFHFDKEASAPYTEDDRIVVLNVAMNVSRNKYYVGQRIYLIENIKILRFI